MEIEEPISRFTTGVNRSIAAADTATLRGIREFDKLGATIMINSINMVERLRRDCMIKIFYYEFSNEQR